MWDVTAFSQIEYDSEKNIYKVIEVIDERAYVLGDFQDESEIDITACREEFLTKISKHKFGLASYPHLGELENEISNLEDQWHVKVRDENWSFENVENPLDIIFAMTPFQKAVYDAIDSSTFDEIKKSLARYRSKNFDVKIQKNLDELVELGLVRKSQNYYEKTNF
jgi:predicted transcriptional regulator